LRRQPPTVGRAAAADHSPSAGPSGARPAAPRRGR